ncbi:MAG: hypothetical protein IJ580_03470 [Prevotella sp.]|nr:hypothetical protein [Prevotella sp.]
MVTAQSFESLKRSTGRSTLYAAVEDALNGKISADNAKATIASADEFVKPYNGKTPIYLILDYLAKHPKKDCAVAEELLKSFAANKKFDINLRYSSLMPPLAYLLRQNYDFLGGKFSKDYISDEALKAIIEAGATVNTYNTDGSSLMSFAITTENNYLQNYLADKGADMRHSDQGGQDDVFKIINTGNVTLLQKLIANNGVKIDINSLKNEPSSFKQHTEMYNYVAEHCAKQCLKYEDIILFRKRFADKTSLTQARYEQLATTECEAAKTFGDVLKVESRYPDLTNMTATYKRKIYDRDCQKLKELYLQTQSVVKASPFKTMAASSGADDFMGNYSNYDPARQMPLANEMRDFYTVCAALNLSTNRKYWRDYPVSILGIVIQNDFSFNETRAISDKKLLEKARKICRGESNYGYGDYYLQALPKLQEKETALMDNFQKNIDEYNRAVDDWNRHLAERESGSYSNSSSSSYSSSSSKREEKKEKPVEKSSSDIDPETVEIPSYEVEEQVEHRKAVLIPLPDEPHTEYLIRFDDGKRCTIKKYYDQKTYWAEDVGENYDTWDNAIAASYVMKKYGKKRKHGKVGFFGEVY